MSISQLLADYRMHICTAMSGYGAKKQTAWDNADKCASAILGAVDQMLADAQTQIANAKNAQITDLHAMAESNQATIDRLLAEVQALRELADTQAAIITAKNAEIAEMKDDYAGALVNDDEAGMMLAAQAGA